MTNPTTISNAQWQGVNNLLDAYIKVTANDHLIIAFANDSTTAAAWILSALDDRGISRSAVPMRPLVDPSFSARLSGAVQSALALKPAARMVVVTLERDTMSHSAAILDGVKGLRSKDCLLVRCISVCADLFALALSVLPEELSAINAFLLNRLIHAKSIRVVTQSGSDIKVQLNSDKYRWISNRGKVPEGGFMIIPAGEVATYPSQIDGRFVADFAFNVNTFVDIDCRFPATPVTVEIKNGKAVSYFCEDKKIESLLSGCFKFENGRNVGEIGFGTNRGIINGTALNSHINERRLGIHLGFGDHNQYDLVDYKCRIHLDLIARGAKIWIDDDLQPIDLDNLSVGSEPHPDNTLHQDAFEFNELGEGQHCCGAQSMLPVKNMG
jgi:hypothetical protein